MKSESKQVVVVSPEQVASKGLTLTGIVDAFGHPIAVNSKEVAKSPKGEATPKESTPKVPSFQATAFELILAGATEKEVRDALNRVAASKGVPPPPHSYPRWYLNALLRKGAIDHAPAGWELPKREPRQVTPKVATAIEALRAEVENLKGLLAKRGSKKGTPKAPAAEPTPSKVASK